MERFEDIQKSTLRYQSIQRYLGISSQFDQIIKAQENITKNISGMYMAFEIVKNMRQHHRMFRSPTLSAIAAVTQGLSFQSKFAIPKTTIEAIISINQQQAQLLSGITTLTKALKIQSPALEQINNLNIVFSGISGQIAAIAAQQKRWTIIDDFEEVTEQAIAFTESLTEEVTEKQKRQFQILITLVTTFFKKYGIQGLLIIDIFLRFAGIHQYYDFLQQKPDLPTKQEVNNISIKQDSVLYFITEITEQLKQAKEYRITNRDCEVKLKPKSKTLTLLKLPKDFEVIIVQIHHKWVFVSYFDPKDNLPQTGWIMKKYLSKPE